MGLRVGIRKAKKRAEKMNVPNWMRRGPKINPFNRRKTQQRKIETIPGQTTALVHHSNVLHLVPTPTYTTKVDSEPKPDRRRREWFLKKQVYVERRKR
jgi:hypothetical protein